MDLAVSDRAADHLGRLRMQTAWKIDTQGPDAVPIRSVARAELAPYLPSRKA